ncbi:hypothetical protein B0H11DRAFT_201385 [Mycena galericulata]|nr:hypothetical protein B0H11DRAFT_201385 [Mycena galericulata]
MTQYAPELEDSASASVPKLDFPASHSSPLTQLPEELIEYIAECMRYPIYPQFEATQVFLTEGHSGFSTARFSLSSFSKVCTSTRFIVERLLYRDIHVDVIGWTRHVQAYDTQKHPIWPAGCLRLLLRTLEARPELGGFVRTVYIRWCEHPMTIQEQLQFLSDCCPQLQSLAFSSLPESLVDYLESLKLQITSFAAVSPAANLPRVIRIFPSLRNLHLHLHGEPSAFSVPDHKITDLHLKLIADRGLQKRLLQLAFAVPRHTVRYFYLEGQDAQSENNLALAAFTQPPPSMQACVEHLRLKNIDPFRQVKLDGVATSPLAAMSSLRHLHIMRPFLLSVNAFDLLPLYLRSISFSDYALDSTMSAAASKSRFVHSVIECLKNLQNRRLAGVKTYGAVPDDPWELGNLKPIHLLCHKEGVPFIQIGSFADIEPELIVFFK